MKSYVEYVRGMCLFCNYGKCFFFGEYCYEVLEV